MKRSRVWSWRWVGAVVLGLQLLARPASAFDESVHERLTRRVLAGSPDCDLPMPPLTTADLASFWSWVRSRALAGLPPARARDLETAWPDGDVRALKRLLSLDPETAVIGIDRLEPRDLGATRCEQLVLASAHPDRDSRDRNRLLRDDRNAPLHDRWGEVVPDDPATLNLGNATGLSSQASAHYGLVLGPHAQDLDTLRHAPHRYVFLRAAGMDDALAFAPQRAQLYADLALLARTWNGPGAARLDALFTGQGWHYLEDMGSQLHTVQVGIFDFFLRAKLLYWKRALWTAGGWLAPLRPFTSVGVDIISNHHVWVESWTARRLADAEAGRHTGVGDITAEIPHDDPAFSVPDASGDPRFVEQLVQRAVEVSGPEGGALYAAAAAVTVPRLRTDDFVLDDRADPDPYLAPGKDARPVADLVRTGLRRVATALRAWIAWDRTRTVGEGADPFAAGVASRLLDARADVAARRTRYLAGVQPGGSATVHDPMFAVLDAVLLVVAALVLRARVRRPRSR